MDAARRQRGDAPRGFTHAAECVLRTSECLLLGDVVGQGPSSRSRPGDDSPAGHLANPRLVRWRCHQARGILKRQR